MTGEERAPRHASFAPVIRSDARLLVCGSLPGARSLAAGRYYAHPQNQFWRLIGAVIDRDLPAMGYEQRLQALLEHGIGLWDVVASAVRAGSLDGAIRDAAPHDLPALIRAHTGLRAVAFNGGTAARIGRRLTGDLGVAAIDLPSSSPAYTLPFAQKRERWLILRDFL